MTARVREKNRVTEVVGEERHSSPRSFRERVKTVSRLAMIIGSTYDLGDSGPGGWWIVHMPELHLGGDVLVPDLAGWRCEHMPEYPETAGCNVPPDWICEVIVPSSGGFVRARKGPAYARVGVEYLWLIEAACDLIEIKRLVSGCWSLEAVFSGDEAVRALPFSDLEFNAAKLWTSPLPTP
jgi:Uma2 family endonuclease